MNSKLMVFGLALMLLSTLAFADGQATDNNQAIIAQEKLQGFGPMFTGKGIAINLNTAEDADLKFIKFAIGRYPGKILDSTNPDNVLTNKAITLLGVMHLGKDSPKYILKNVVIENGKMNAEVYAKTSANNSTDSAANTEMLVGKFYLEKTDKTAETNEGVKDEVSIWKGSLEISIPWSSKATDLNQKYKLYMLVQKKTVVKELKEQKMPPYKIAYPEEVQQQTAQGQPQIVQEQTNPFGQMIQGVMNVMGFNGKQVEAQEKIKEAKKTEEGCLLGNRIVPKEMKFKLGNGKTLKCNGGGAFVEISEAASENSSNSAIHPIQAENENSISSNSGN